MTHLTGIKACVFDAYGTLFDVHAAAAALKQEIGPKADQLSATWRTKQLEYTWLRSLMPAYKPFWQVTQDGLDYALEEAGLADRTDLRQKLLDLYFNLAAYPEVPDMLAKLQAKGISTAILSNGSLDMLNGAVGSAGIADRLDAVLSVEAVGIFKPDPRIYQLVTDHFNLPERTSVAFMSSNGWDAAAAAHYGFQTVWVNRFGKPWERLEGTPKAVLTSLEKLPDLITC
ncbi:MAG TPA: haloacid dehalogenase type II [Rhodospirillaceae bacterium]|nr:haloacid dehalogenase type II [Rhodospirillaceae bacterium]MAX61216.1 haloacid dehalogenase type II [Rhodospirillaceae bacterium]HAE03553.1 haloacid dehalogenase type II [Rhodospirillaceae bacterium]HAJ21721.1 haloacid dehalogenase type II [Rhodospirillaceae bacterium]HBM14523.1 haloacid dehalogenase type II [Rhodospirillaceae bacterium]|tara:strand:+ start:66928 stop:67614 length:687 start_codon:yes stop_codon:yes gene_type:complete